MTGEELKTLADDILDNNADWSDDHFLVLLNIAKTKVESLRMWQYLKKVTTISSTALPADFAEDYKVMIGTSIECLPVPFEENLVYSNYSNRYYIDWANLTINFLGTSSSGTKYLFYKRFTPAVTLLTSPEMPERFQPLLSYYAAEIHQQGTDSDDIFARMGPKNRLAAQELERAMKAWDNNIVMRAQNNQVGVADSNSELPLGQW